MSRARLLGECVKEGWGTRRVRGERRESERERERERERVRKREMSFKKENESGWVQKKKEKSKEGRSD